MKSLLTALLVAAMLTLPGAASAAFVGAYDAFTKWDQVQTGDPPGGGMLWGMWPSGVDLSGAPHSIALITGNEGCSKGPCTTQFVLREGIPASGTISFQWRFVAAFDPFGYVLNGIFHQLTDDNGPNEQSGAFSLFVNKGDTFAFSLDCGMCDQYPSLAEVWDFTGPEAEVPEPATLALVGIGVAGLAYRLRRRSQT